MKLLTILAVSLILGSVPARAGMIPVQEADEAANCALKSAALVTPAPESVVIFPEDSGACRETESEPRDNPKDDGAQNDAIGVENTESATEIANLSLPFKQ